MKRPFVVSVWQSGHTRRMARGDGSVIRPEEIARVVVRPLGTVLPLGFLAFGTGIFVTAAYGLGWIPAKDARLVHGHRDGAARHRRQVDPADLPAYRAAWIEDAADRTSVGRAWRQARPVIRAGAVR